MALDKIGGIACIRHALIDDCSLAAAVKQARLPHLVGADTDHRESACLQYARQYLADGGSHRLYAVVLFTALAGGNRDWHDTGVFVGAPCPCYRSDQSVAALSRHGGTHLGSMAIAYGPTVRFYGLNGAWALTLPLIAFLYTLMTLDSARRHWQGRGGAWKGRVYPRKS